jgi:hypothetical protein
MRLFMKEIFLLNVKQQYGNCAKYFHLAFKLTAITNALLMAAAMKFYIKIGYKHSYEL